MEVGIVKKFFPGKFRRKFLAYVGKDLEILFFVVIFVAIDKDKIEFIMKGIKEQINKSIACIMREFAFDEVHEVMEKMDYRWGKDGDYKVPSVEEVKSFVIEELLHLKDMAMDETDKENFPLYLECGRFIFRCYADGHMCAIFAPESIDTGDYM